MTRRRMPRPAVVKQLAWTTLREFVRSREALFWTYGFPILMAVVLGLAFGESGMEKARVAVLESASAAQVREVIAADPWLSVEIVSAADAEQALFAGDLDLVVGGTLDEPRLQRHANRSASELAALAVERALQVRAGREDVVRVEAEFVPARSERYIDFLLPGLIGLNLLGAGIWGIGFNLVQMRIKSLLRRLVVAPMLKVEFLLGFLLSRMGLVVLDALAILGFGMLVFSVPMNGSWALLLLVILLSGLAFTGLGLVVASRPTTVEGVSGLMNLVVLPMWLMGGSFFSTSHFPSYFRPLTEVMPLTHANDALRAVMLDGAGIAVIWPQLLFLAVFAVFGFGVALRIFRWT